MANTRRVEVTLKADDCIKCAACSSIAPEIFLINEVETAQIIRQPVTEEEITLCEAASSNCPVEAIFVRELQS